MVEMENSTCECGKKFHACTSCDFAHGWQYTFCGKDCWEHSKEYREAVAHMLNVLDALDCDCLDDLAHVLDDVSGDYYGTFIKMLMGKKDEKVK